MNELNKSFNCNKVLADKIKLLRIKALKRKRKYSERQLRKPVSFWIKNDRLLSEIGKEFTVILRTRGCNWALSETGGCSMCGYVQDANIEEVDPDYIINQFDFALENKLNEIEEDNNNYILKLFNSGSFFDENEIVKEVRTHIYDRVENLKKIKEIVVESRVEYITSEKLKEMRNKLKDKYIEIGIGLETVSDYIRNNYINKGLLFKEFIKAIQKCKENKIGVRTYLLFKPPFLNEQGAIDDCMYSIRKLIDLNVNTISINPLNIQKGSLAEYLWFQGRYRPPWFYSLITYLKKSLTQKNLKKVRVVCDPTRAGTKRGIHNCLKRECNEYMKEILKKFVLKQNLEQLKQIKFGFECNCKIKYDLQRFL